MIRHDRIPLSKITSISRFNMRYGADGEDLTSLMASIREEGLLQAITVRWNFEAYEVIAGARRWRALRNCIDLGWFKPNQPVDVNIFDGSDAEAHLLSVAENLQQKTRHPVDEYEAFVSAIGMGSTEDEIRRAFGLTKRHLDERLALGRLSPKVRDAWRRGTLTAESAKLFTLGSLDEQEALLGEPYWLWNHAHNIRAYFKKTGVPGDDPRAIFIGADAYRRAGGAIEETIFDTFFNNDKLLDRLVDEKLMAEGENIAAQEGWGIVLTDPLGASCSVAIELTPVETARCDEIDVSDHDDITKDEWHALQREAHEIREAAILRAVPEALRGNLAICTALGDDGAPLYARGLTTRKEKHVAGGIASPETTGLRHRSEDDDDDAEASHFSSSQDSEKPNSEKPKPEKPGTRIREVLDAAIAGGLRHAISNRPDLAMIVLVASFASYRKEAIDLYGMEIAAPRSALLQSLRDPDQPHRQYYSFDEAITRIGAAPLCDLSVALAEQVAHCFKPDNEQSLSGFDALMRVLAERGASLRAGFLAALDYDAYFAGATKAAILTTLDALDVVGVERAAKKNVLAALAAREAKAKQWLPKPLSDWAAILSTHPHAVASSAKVADFCDRDDAQKTVSKDRQQDVLSRDNPSNEERLLAGIRCLNDAPSEMRTADGLATMIRAFIDECCDKETKLIKHRVKVEDLFHAFETYAIPLDVPLLSEDCFETLVIDAGYPKKPYRGAIYFSGISLRPDAISALTTERTASA